MTFDKESFKVKMSGKEYLDYKKYQDKKPKFKLTSVQLGMIIIFVSVFIGAVAIAGIDLFFSEPIEKPDYVNAFIQSGNMDWSSLFMAMILINPAIFYFIFIAIGVAWMIHGFGFIIIKR